MATLRKYWTTSSWATLGIGSRLMFAVSCAFATGPAAYVWQRGGYPGSDILLEIAGAVVVPMVTGLSIVVAVSMLKRDLRIARPGAAIISSAAFTLMWVFPIVGFLGAFMSGMILTPCGIRTKFDDAAGMLWWACGTVPLLLFLTSLTRSWIMAISVLVSGAGAAYLSTHGGHVDLALAGSVWAGGPLLALGCWLLRQHKGASVPGRCAGCGYDLQPTPLVDQCPECGRATEPTGVTAVKSAANAK